MTPEVRRDLHRRIAYAKWEAYAKAPDNGSVAYGSEWIFAPEATIMCPLFNDGAPQSISDYASEEMMSALQDLGPDGDMLTPEIRMWWKHMPDWRLVSPFDCNAADWGFSVVDTYAGTLADGTVMNLREWDYIWTNDDGHITRWEWFVDSREWYPYLNLIGLPPKGLTYQTYVANYLREGRLGA